MSRHFDEYALDILASGPDPRDSDLASSELPEDWTLADIREHLTGCARCSSALDHERGFFEDLATVSGDFKIDELTINLREALDAPVELVVDAGSRKSNVVMLWALGATAIAALALVAFVFFYEIPPPDAGGEIAGVEGTPSELEQAIIDAGMDPDSLRAALLEDVTPEPNLYEHLEEAVTGLAEDVAAEYAEEYAQNDDAEDSDPCLRGCSMYSGLFDLDDEALNSLSETLN